jgi:hypothetical protein
VIAVGSSNGISAGAGDVDACADPRPDGGSPIGQVKKFGEEERGDITDNITEKRENIHH